MSSKGKRYPKHYVKQRKQRIITNEKPTPTENDNSPINDNSNDQFQNYNTLKSNRVPVEDSFFSRAKHSLRELGAILASIVVFVAVIFWAARIEFKVDKSEVDITEHKSSIKKLTTKVQDINIYRSGLEKDIYYLKESKKETEQKILKINYKLDKPNKNTNK